MAGNNSLQMLRGTSSAISASTATLLAGQPLYDLTNNLLYVGDGSTTQIKSKAPIAAGSIKKANGTEILGVNSDRAHLTFGDASLKIYDGVFYLEGTQGSYYSQIYFDDGQLRLEHSSDNYHKTDSYLKMDSGVVHLSAAGDNEGSGTGDGARLMLSDSQKQYSNGKGRIEVTLSDSTTSDSLDWGQGNLDMKLGSFGSLSWDEDDFTLELGDSANNGKVTSTFSYDGESEYSFKTTLALESSARSTMTLRSEDKVNLRAQYIDYSAGENIPTYTGEYASLTVSTSSVYACAHSTSGGASAQSTISLTSGQIALQTSTVNYLKISPLSINIAQALQESTVPTNDINIDPFEIAIQRRSGRGLKLTDSTAYFAPYMSVTGIPDPDNTNTTYIDQTGLHIRYAGNSGKINLSSAGLDFAGLGMVSMTSTQMLRINALTYDKSITAYSPTGSQTFKIDLMNCRFYVGSSNYMFWFPQVTKRNNAYMNNILGLATSVTHSTVTTSSTNNQYAYTFIGSTTTVQGNVFIRAVSSSGSVTNYSSITDKTIHTSGSTYNINVGGYLYQMNEIVITNLSTSAAQLALYYSNMLGTAGVLQNYNVPVVCHPAEQITIYPAGWKDATTLNLLIKREELVDSSFTGITS